MRYLPAMTFHFSREKKVDLPVPTNRLNNLSQPPPFINIATRCGSLLMDRKLLITIHMYLAAFFTPAVLLVAISGGLYLAGFKGDVEQKTIFSNNELIKSS